MSIEDKLYTIKSTPDKVSHLIPDEKYCQNCENRICTKICPANVYEWENDKLIINYENCLECGACRVCCKHIEWKYPTNGVTFKLG